ncbi:MAG: type I-C CRISPR-associated protein Cas8c/Csd1 [Lachnospiraceae bacterium]|nr:type I-C CRISPR-associated protein Cas8c/Csd1 [Lachnospiraceae bacterium]
MILQALVKYYEDMAAKGKIAEYGWGPAKISYVLCIDEDGNLLQAISVKEESANEKKKTLVPQSMILPAAVKRSSGVAPNFLWDNSAYILGIDGKGNAERARNCFEACKEFHKGLLKDIDIPEAKALLCFFDKWAPDSAKEHPALAEEYEDIIASSNLVFQFQGRYLHENTLIREAWTKYYQGTDGKAEGICLVTGKTGPVAVLHPSIKGIPGAQSSGASLVSFNAPSFCSYGQEQGFNASTSEYAAFAYGAALNYLISERDHHYRIGDTTVLCWAEGGEGEYPGLMGFFAFGAKSPYSEKELTNKVHDLLKGKYVEIDGRKLDPEKPFYILGISPNAARLSVRFFLQNSFGNILRNVNEHYERLRIQRPADDFVENLPLWRLLSETVNQNARDKSPAPKLAGEVLRAVLTGGRYPATLLNGVILRIRAEHKVTRGRAAIIKAYYSRNINPYVPKEEVLKVSLNKESSSIPYQLGRLFSTLEAIQSAANPGINSTIKDKYFNSASATPAVVFPVLIKLAEKHLKKIKGGLHKTLATQLSEVLGKIGEEFPARLNLPQQGSFQLGYYHQTTVRFESKKKEEE